jgi:hypothetical protein
MPPIADVLTYEEMLLRQTRETTSTINTYFTQLVQETIAQDHLSTDEKAKLVVNQFTVVLLLLGSYLVRVGPSNYGMATRLVQSFMQRPTSEYAKDLGALAGLFLPFRSQKQSSSSDYSS